MIDKDTIDNIKEALLDSMHFDDVETLEEAGMIVDDDEQQGMVISMENGNQITLILQSEDEEVKSHVEATVESAETD